MAINSKRIFFGHQSVGNNIIEGVRALSGAVQSLSIVETRTLGNDQGPVPVLLHAAVGKNQDPLSKIHDFQSLMEGGMGNEVDIAGFKFCYIDIKRETDVKSLFASYETIMHQLSEKFPRTRFLHVTVPLRTVEPGGRMLLKKLLGKQSILLQDNWKRQQFNEMMRSTYKGNQPLFDLAKLESTFPTGKRCASSLNGHAVYSLVPEYTNDGGHLNALGQQIVAQHFVDCLQQIN